MNIAKRILAVFLTLTMAVTLFTFSTGAIESQQEWIEKNWSRLLESKGSLLMTPGEDNTKMNFHGSRPIRAVRLKSRSEQSRI